MSPAIYRLSQLGNYNLSRKINRLSRESLNIISDLFSVGVFNCGIVLVDEVVLDQLNGQRTLANTAG